MINILEITTLLELGLIYGIVAVGVYLTFRVIDFPDLTCDGSFVLGAAVSAMLIKYNFNPFLGLAAAMLCGGLAGVITGILHTRFKITNLLSGILMSFMLYSINLRVMNGVPNIALISEPTIFTGMNQLFILALISCAVYVCFGYILNTDFGLGLRSVGYNRQLARNSGVNISVATIVALAMSNALTALGGGLFSQHQCFADVGSGLGTVIIGLASVMIGEKLFPQRSLWIRVVSCLAGSVLYRVFIGLALHGDVLGLATQDMNLITGLLVIVVMMLRRSC